MAGSKKWYLGDAVYADWWHDDLVLTTEDGISVTNRIVLEPAVLVALRHFLDRRYATEADDGGRE